MYDVHCVGVWHSVDVSVGATLPKQLLTEVGAVRLFLFLLSAPVCVTSSKVLERGLPPVGHRE